MDTTQAGTTEAACDLALKREDLARWGAGKVFVD